MTMVASALKIACPCRLAYLVLLLASTAVSLSPSVAAARTWVVAQNGTGDFSSVAAACDTAAAGDSILIQPGEYREEAYDGQDGVRIMFTRRPVSIIGDGPAEAVSLQMKFGFNECDGFLLENVRVHDLPYSAIGIWSGSGVIRSCQFEGNSNPSDGGALACYMGDLVVEDSVFKWNRAESSGGAIRGGTTLTLRGCIFRGNEAGNSGGAVFLPSRGSVENCLFIGNAAPQAAAIETSKGILKGSTFYGNDCLDTSNYGAAIKITGDWVGNTPDHCIIAGTIRGFGLWCSGIGVSQCTDFWDNELGADPGGLYCDIAPERGNFEEDPLLCDPEHGDFGLSENSPCLPGNHNGFDCGLIGAGAEHCGIVRTEETTWGKVRMLWR